MFRRGRGRGRGGSGGITSVKLKGLFTDGTWHCNCNPRLPAEHFRVKKESANKGRWFYTCQKPEGRRCDMFLWEEDAKPREEATVLCNSRSEPQPATSTTPRAGARRSSPPPPYTSVTGPSHVGVNQADVDTEDEEEETFPWPLTGAEEAEITRRADRISPPPVTPKKPNTSNAYPTPTTGKRKISNVEDVEYPDLTTPHTTRKVDERLDNTAPRFDASSRTIGATPQTTPTPSRFKDALAGPESFDLTGEVFAILQNHNVRLNNETQDALRSLLNRSDLRIQGIMKGRDVSRLQIKAKDARIAEQVHRISTLEAELEAEKAMVQHMRWERQSGAGPD